MFDIIVIVVKVIGDSFILLESQDAWVFWELLRINQIDLFLQSRSALLLRIHVGIAFHALEFIAHHWTLTFRSLCRSQEIFFLYWWGRLLFCLWEGDARSLAIANMVNLWVQLLLLILLLLLLIVCSAWVKTWHLTISESVSKVVGVWIKEFASFVLARKDE